MAFVSRLCHALALLAALTLPARAAEPVTMTWDIDGAQRQALVFAPASPPESGGSPLVFAFHGHGGNMRGTARRMQFQTAWPEAIVVYMQGVPTATTVDPEGKRPGWQRNAGELGNRDVKFFDAVLASLREKYKVDDNRIYAVGLSNGAFFAYVLWAERPGTFAAFAPCIGLPWPTLKLTVPKPVFIVAGKEDKLVSITKQEEAIERVRKLNGATATAQPNDDGIVIYTSDKGPPVQTLIHPGGHNVPPNTTNLIVDFFRAHELKK